MPSLLLKVPRGQGPWERMALVGHWKPLGHRRQVAAFTEGAKVPGLLQQGKGERGGVGKSGRRAGLCCNA